MPESKCPILLHIIQLAQTLLYVLFHLYRVEVIMQWSSLRCSAPLNYTTYSGRAWESETHSGPSVVPPAWTVYQPSPEWATTTPLLLLPLQPHTRRLFSGTLLYLLLPNWEWMSSHWGVENNGWGQLGTLSAKHHGDLCLPEKPSMHIPLCGSQKLNNQCCCMEDNWINNQLCRQASNGCELESAIAHTDRAHLDGNGGKSNSFPDKQHRHINTLMWLKHHRHIHTLMWLSLYLSVFARTYMHISNTTVLTDPGQIWVWRIN